MLKRPTALLEHICRHVHEDLMQDNSGKWKHRMTRSQIRRFDRIACRWLQEYGYESCVQAEVPPAALPSLFWRCDNKLRKLLRADYWKDNLYKVSLRSREAIR